MTINTWRNDILRVCKYCKQFTDNKKRRNRYKCGKYDCHIYDAHKCGKTLSLRQQAAEISKKALDDAYLALVGGA